MTGKLAGPQKQMCNIPFKQLRLENKSFWGAKNQQVRYWYSAWGHW